VSRDIERAFSRGEIGPVQPGPYDDAARDAMTVEDALVALHHLGASPMAAIKALVTGRGVSLGDAKHALHSSPAWAKEAREAEAAHKVMAAAWDAIELEQLESALAGAILREHRDPRELLERLVDALLIGPAGRESLNTDGLEVSRELKSPDGYRAVGHVWMLPTGREPVHVRLVFSEDARTVLSAEVHFALSSVLASSPSMSHEKALKLLLAYPEKAAHHIPWAYAFHRDGSGWRRLS
jgi:ribosomal protein L7/L12